MLPIYSFYTAQAFADEYSSGRLDLEAFFVACRLCAHAQQAEDETAAAEVACKEGAAETPSAPPWFEGYERSEEGASSRKAPSAETLGSSRQASSGSGRGNGGGNFDFEAAAFGSGSAGSSSAVRPAGGTGLGAMPILPVPGAAEHWHRPGGSSGGFYQADSSSVIEEHQSASALAKGLGLRQPEQTAAATTAHAAQRRADVRSDPAKRLGEELLEGRQALEQKLSEKRRLQKRSENLRKQLDTLHGDRQQVVSELSIRQCDLQHMFAQLDFSRQQIEATEREVAHMRSVRQAFSQDEVIRMERTRSRFEGERVALGEDRHDVRASVQMSQDMWRQDRRNVLELTDHVKRTERRKMELQSKQSLMLEDQRHAEQERGAMLYALELERVKLHTMRSERLDIGGSAKKILQEARKLAKDTGVEPAVFADCFLPRTQPESQEPIDPLAAPSNPFAGGAWGPAAEHARGSEDTSAWKNAVYRHGKSGDGAPRFSVSGGNVDLTTGGPQWQHFGKGGGHPGTNGGKGHHHWRNQGLLGVPASHGEGHPGYGTR
jgi:hypothetical protein